MSWYGISLSKLSAGCGVIMFFASPAYAGCSGDACKDVSVQKQSGCIVIKNNSDSKAKVEGADSFTLVVYVYAHSEETPKWQGQCMKDWYSNYKATFVN